MNKRMWILLTILVFALSFPIRASAQNTEDIEESFLKELKLDELDNSLAELLKDSPFGFSEGVKKMMRGEIPITGENIKELIIDGVQDGFGKYKRDISLVLALSIASALLMNFTSILEKSQTAQMGYYVVYLLMFTVLMQSFQVMCRLLETTLSGILIFMKLLIPSYFLASVLASGTVTGLAFYEFTLVLVTGLEWMMQHLLLPGTQMYLLFMLLNYLVKEDYLTRFAELLKLGIEWAIKTMTALVIGFQTVQCMVMPAVDHLKSVVLKGTAGAIPGIGNAFNSITESVLGAAVLIKNGIGAAGLLVIVILVLGPLIQLIFGMVMYKLIAAVIQPVSDKRTVGCISAVGDSAGLLVKLLFTAAFLFFISLAIVTASIGGG